MDKIYINDVEVFSAEEDSYLMVIFNNLTGKNMQGQEWLDYLQTMKGHNAAVVPGEVEFYRNDERMATGRIPQVIRGAGQFK